MHLWKQVFSGTCSVLPRVDSYLSGAMGSHLSASLLIEVCHDVCIILPRVDSYLSGAMGSHLSASLLIEVCHDVCIESGLQLVSNDILTGASDR